MVRSIKVINIPQTIEVKKFMIFIFLSCILKAFITKDQEQTILFVECNAYFLLFLIISYIKVIDVIIRKSQNLTKTTVLQN